MQPVVLPYPEDYHLPSNSAVDSPLDYLLNQSAASAASRRRLLPSWSVLRQTIRLINRMTICQTLMEVSSLTGYLKVKHVRMFSKDARTARTFVRILFANLNFDCHYQLRFCCLVARCFCAQIQLRRTVSLSTRVIGQDRALTFLVSF